MAQHQSHQPDYGTSGGQLFEFVDEAHEVTDEERNRPQYGRPVRKPLNPQPEPSKAEEPPPAAQS